MQWHKRKAEKLGKLTRESSDKTWTQLTLHYLIEFDSGSNTLVFVPHKLMIIFLQF